MRQKAFVVVKHKIHNEFSGSSEAVAVFFNLSNAEDYLESVRSEQDEENSVEWTIQIKFVDL